VFFENKRTRPVRAVVVAAETRWFGDRSNIPWLTLDLEAGGLELFVGWRRSGGGGGGGRICGT